MVTPIVREGWQCQYRGGPCGAPRAVKDDGSLHTLCSEHRRRANLNQWRSQERRRRLRTHLVQAALAAAATTSNGRSSPPKRRNSAAAAAVSAMRVPVLDLRQPAAASPPIVDTQSTDLGGGMPLMSADELFAPIKAVLTAELPPLEHDADVVADLFRMIDSDSSCSLFALLDGGFTPMQ